MNINYVLKINILVTRLRYSIYEIEKFPFTMAGNICQQILYNCNPIIICKMQFS